MREPLVIITRPLAQAEGFASKVRAVGRAVEIFPLMEIHALIDNKALDLVLARLPDFALVAFVSPNAVDAVFNRIENWPAGVSIAVMGAGSRIALARHGITDANARIISPTDRQRTDSETLLKELDLDSLLASQVLIVRGERGRELLADTLRDKSISVTQIAAYRRGATELTLQRKKRFDFLISQNNDWIVTSSEVLRTMLFWAKQSEVSGAVANLLQQHIIVSHVRIEETAKILGFQSITLTGSGDECLLVALQLCS